MDLLSALTHEVGHLLDYEHGHEGYDVMAAVLPPGPRVLRILEPEPLVSQPIPQLSRAFVSAALVSEAPFAIRFSLRTGSVDANQVMIGGLQRDSSISVLDMMPIDSSKDWRALCADRAIAMLYREQQSDNSDDDLREDDLLDLVIADVFNG
jgi:hypothetical protein